jgi:hypothetical protein
VRQILEDAEHLIAVWNERQAKAERLLTNFDRSARSCRRVKLCQLIANGLLHYFATLGLTCVERNLTT